MAEKLYYDSSLANQEIYIDPDPALATPSCVKKNYLFRNASTKESLVGTMPVNLSQSIKIDPKVSSSNSDNNEYYIPEGYHDGTGKVYVGNLSEYTYGTAIAGEIASNKVAWVNGVRIVGTLDIGSVEQPGTATAADIADGKTAWVNKQKITGTIPRLARQDKTLLAGDSYTVPYGISAGTSIISAASLATQTPGTATPSEIITGYTAWVNGTQITGTLNILEKIKELFSETNALRSQVLYGQKFYSSKYDDISTGTMPNHTGEAPTTIKIGAVYYIPEGYYSGQSYVTTESLANATKATANAVDILYNKTAWVNGVKVTGTMPQLEEKSTITLKAGETETILTGYNPKNYNVTAQDLASQTVGTAIATEIVKDKTAWIDGIKVTGTMPINTDIYKNIDPGDYYNIPLGYHTGGGTVYVKPLAYYTVATATKDKILLDETAWVNGVKVTGTMPNNTDAETKLDPGESYTIPLGYHSGNGKVYVDPLGELTPGTAKPAEILIDKTAWVDGAKITGTMPDNGNVAPDPIAAGESYTIPLGYHSGAGIVTAKDLASQTVGTADDTDILFDKTAWVNGTQITGSLALTGTALANNVMKGTTFYNTNAKSKITGTLELTGTANSDDVLKGTTFYNTNPQTIQTGTLELTGNAETSNVLEGTTFYTTNPKNKQTGTMPNIGHIITEINAGVTYSVPLGYHDGMGYVKAADLAPQTQATADVTDILLGETAWVNGEKITGTLELSGNTNPEDVLYGRTYYNTDPKNKQIGTMPIVTPQIVTLLAGESSTLAKGYHDGTGKVQAEELAPQTVGTATSDDILLGETAWVNGTKITGAIAPQPTKVVRIAAGNSITLSPGWYPDGIIIYSIRVDCLDLTGTDAYVIGTVLYPNSAGYVDGTVLVITAELRTE